jgi:hypothetical protein
MASDGTDQEYPKRSEWEDFFEGHGVEIKRRFVELPNDAYWVYRANCEAAELAVQAQTVEDCLAMMIEHIVSEDRCVESDTDHPDGGDP